MNNEKPIYRPFPKVPLERRAWAFVIDFLVIWLLSAIAGVVLQWLVFLGLWMLVRVVIAERNKGQTLGRWLFDMKVLDPRFKKIPTLVTLIKREGILGSAACLAMIGLQYYNLTNGIGMILLCCPLFADCALALADERFQQAFHDQMAQTVIVQTRRGFSLDLRLKKLLAQLQQNMRK
jgi:uncharacterized RDD family membrane protein YckC